MRDRRERDWFWIENDVVDRTDINIYEKMLYICLARHSYGKEYSFPAIDTLCKELNVKDKRTIIKYAKNLEKKGFISIEKRMGKANKYYLNNIKKVDTSHVPTLTQKEACNVGTSYVSSNIPCNRVGTFHAESSDIPCTPNNKRIINTNNKTTTPISDNKNYSKNKKSSSSYEFLNKFNLSSGTLKNINSLPRLTEEKFESIFLEIKKQYDLGKIKSFEAVLFKALKGEWNLIPNSTKKETPLNLEKVAKAHANDCLSYLTIGWDKDQVYHKLFSDTLNKPEVYILAKQIIDDHFQRRNE